LAGAGSTEVEVQTSQALTEQVPEVTSDELSRVRSKFDPYEDLPTTRDLTAADRKINRGRSDISKCGPAY
jgi:hypothetical protein